MTVASPRYVAGLRGAQGGRDGRLGTAGFVVTSVGLVGPFLSGVASMITKDSEALGPAYLLGTFVSIIGLILLSIAAIRAHVLPWWSTLAVTVGWIVGGLVGDAGPLGFKASALLLAAAAIAAAATAKPAA